MDTISELTRVIADFEEVNFEPFIALIVEIIRPDDDAILLFTNGFLKTHLC